MLGDSIIKKIIILSTLLAIVYFSLTKSLAVSNIMISCPPSTCVVNNCQCTISGCGDGFIYFYSTTDCSLIPTSNPPFSGSSFNWQPVGAGKYYVSVMCSNQNRSDCTEVNVSLGNVTTSTTTTIKTGCSYDNPCPADCGKNKLIQQTDNQDYYEFTINSASNVTIQLDSSSNVDYDLYVKWDGNKADENNYDCKPSLGMGMTEVCTNNGLLEGTYYLMINHYDGQGTYNLSLTCESILPPSCSNPDQPCKIDCGKNKLDRSTQTQEYFTFKLGSTSNVTIKMFPSSQVDYDLYVNWDETKPTMNKYDCKPSFGTGEEEECSSILDAGYYYFMIDHYDGVGTYDLSLSCSIAKTTTTVATTIIPTSIPSGSTSTTANAITSTKKPSTCGNSGSCVNQNNNCNTGYEPCPENDDVCALDEKCCCLKGSTAKSSTNYFIVIGIFLTLVLVVLVFFYLKSKSTITYEKLYRKWTRVLLFDNKL